MKLRTRLLIAFVLVGILSVAATGIEGFITARDSLRQAALDKLTAIRENKKGQVEHYFSELAAKVSTFASDPTIVGAMTEFSSSFGDEARTTGDMKKKAQELRDFYETGFFAEIAESTGKATLPFNCIPENPECVNLQYKYIYKNPYDSRGRQDLDSSPAGSTYDKVHENYHKFIKSYRKLNDLYDIFLVDTAGNVVYSVYKEVDFATNLFSGPYKDTNFARAFDEAREKGESGTTHLVDFEPYLPSYLAPAAFIASGIYKGDELVGVAVFQTPIDEIDRVMTGNRRWNQEGLGKTGQTFLVGKDYRMRSDSRLLIEKPDEFFSSLKTISSGNSDLDRIRAHATSILFLEVKTEAVERALAGESGAGTFSDIRGKRVLCAFTPIQTLQLKWVLISEIDEAEVFVPVKLLQMRFIIVAFLISLVVSVIALAISNAIARPLMQLVKDIKEFGQGDFSKKVSVHSSDEIGSLGEAFNQMADDLSKSMDQLVQADKLISLGTLVSGVGHEINNPNSYIMINVQSALKIWQSIFSELEKYCHREGCSSIGDYDLEFLAETMPDLLNGTLEGSLRIKAIVQDMKKFINEEPDQLEQLDVNDVVNATISLLKRKIEKSTNSFLPQLSSTPLIVMGNFQRLEQVFVNLIINACESLTSTSSKVSVITHTKQDEGIVVEIADEGKGIPREIIGQIFDPFFTTKRGYGGTGLGLAISGKIVKEHGGKIEVQSDSGAGTVVTVTLPAKIEGNESE